MRLALVAVAGLLAAAAGTMLAVAVNAATGGAVPWFPAVEHHPLWWTTGATAGVAAAGLLVWLAQRRYEAALRELVSAVQRPEPWVVDRPAEVGRIVAALRAGGTVGVTTAVHGAGGFGKTTVAKMVRANSRVLRRFGGRVYWVTVGRDAGRKSLTGLVNDLITRLDSGHAVTFTDAGEAAEHLAAVLARGPRRLLILDDVWTQEQLEVFPVAGRCARLVTTRNITLIGGTGFPVLVDQMTDRQAHAVLTAGLPRLPPALATQLVAETRRWPLLLRLVNKILTDRARLQPDVTAAAGELLGLLRQGQALRLDCLSGAAAHPSDISDSDQRARSVRATIEASTGLLDSSQRARFAELAVFAKNETIPAVLAATLWQAVGGLDAGAAFALLTRLGDLALVTVMPSADGGAIEVHDVIRDFLREELGGPRLRQLHHALLGCAAAGLPAAVPAASEGTVIAWWELPEQSRYLREHLIEHLIAAQGPQAAEVAASDLRWAAARLKQSGPAAPYGDLGLVATRPAQRLQRLLGQCAHLLAATDPPYSQADILCSRVSHDPDWGPQAHALLAASTHPALIAKLPLPDLPHPDLRRSLTGHVGWVYAVAIAPDGSWLASGGRDGTVRVWDTATGQQRRTLTGYGPARAVAIAPDGSWLATGGDDGTVRVWDAATGQQRHALTGYGPVCAVAIAPDGSWLASAGGGGSVWVWDAATGRQRHILTGWDPARAVAIAPDGSWLATGEGAAVHVWDAATGRQRRTLTGHHQWVNAVAIAPDGTWLATGGDDGDVRVWDAATGQPRNILSGYGTVHAIAIAPDGSWLATADLESDVRVWDTATGRQRRTLAGYYDLVHAVAIAPDGSWLATGGIDGTVRVWDATTAQQGHAFAGHGWEKAVAIAPDGSWLATGGIYGNVRVWDAVTGRQRHALTEHRGWVHAVAIAPDGSWLATGGDDGTVRMWDAATGQQRDILTRRGRPVFAVAIAPDGSWLATGGDDGTVRVWDAATGQQRRTVTVHDPVKAVAIAPDGSWLATGGDDGTVRLWDAATAQQRHTLRGHHDRVNAVAIAPDGRWLATGGDDGTVRVWDAATGQQRATLTVYDPVKAVAIAPDGTWLATAGGGALRIWDRATACARAVMRVDSPLSDCAWAPVGKSIVAVGAAGWYCFTFRP